MKRTHSQPADGPFRPEDDPVALEDKSSQYDSQEEPLAAEISPAPQSQPSENIHPLRRGNATAFTLYGSRRASAADSPTPTPRR